MNEILITKFIDSSGRVRGKSLDSATLALLSIDYDHHEIHSGDSYEYTNALDFTSGETKPFLFTIPNTAKWIHFFFDIVGELEYNIDFYEGATPDTVGSPVSAPAIINKDRNSSNTPGMTITIPTLGGGSKGTLIRRHHAGSGKKAGGDLRGVNEVILKRNTQYWTDIKNETNSNNFISWTLTWYEHTNRA